MSEQHPIDSTVDTSLPRPLVRQRRRRRSSPKWLRNLNKRLNPRQNIPKFLVVVVVIIVIGIVGAGVLFTTTSEQVQTSLQSLQRVVTSITAQSGNNLELNDFQRLNTSLIDVINAFKTAYDRASTFRVFLAGNPDLEAQIIQVGAGEQIARAAYAMMQGLQPTVNFLFGETSDDPLAAQISTGERIVELLSIGRPSFVQAAGYLQAAEGLLATIDTTEISPNLLIQLEELRGYHELLVSFQAILVESPDLLTSALGIGGQSSYLVLSANSDELRPSGGYVSTYGWLLVRNGRIEDYSYNATTPTSPNPPPDTMAATYPVPNWWIRYGQPIYAAWDGSWTPDFPTTAEMASWFYNSGSNPNAPVNGVIGIDIVAFEYLLEALEQVTIPEYAVVITPTNFRDLVYGIRAESVETGGDAEHKQFVAAVYRSIFDEWQSRVSDPEFSSQILGVLIQALQEKHLMFYFGDPNINQALDVLGWSGRQAPTVGEDYLMVVDANLGNKSNSSIRRQFIYDVELTPGGAAFSRVTVLYDYSASIAADDPAVDERYHGPLDYVNLLQLYTPAGSTISETEGRLFNPTVVADDTLTQFISQLVVEYDSSERYQFSYAVPGVVHSNGTFQEYNLLIQKQPGMRAELVIVQVTLPQGARLTQASPEPTATYSIERQILEFRFDFRTDTAISVIYQMPES